MFRSAQNKCVPVRWSDVEPHPYIPLEAIVTYHRLLYVSFGYECVPAYVPQEVKRFLFRETAKAQQASNVLQVLRYSGRLPDARNDNAMELGFRVELFHRERFYSIRDEFMVAEARVWQVQRRVLGISIGVELV